MISTLAHEGGQTLTGMVALLSSGQQGKLQSQRIGSLSITHEASGGRDVLGIEGSTHMGGQLPVMICLFSASEDRGGPPHEFCRVGEVGSGNHVRVCARRCRSVRGSGGIEPVAKLEALTPEIAFACRSSNEINPCPHALELSCQHVHVAIALIEYPGYNHRRVSPGGSGDGGTIHYLGYDEGDATCRRLFGSQVGQPRGQETGGIIEEAGGG